MNKKILVMLSIVFSICILAGCTSKLEEGKSQNQEPVPSQNEPEPDPIQEDPIEKQLLKMTLKEKIGQMLIGGVEGAEISDQERKLIQDIHIGGFILFGKNMKSPEQLLSLTNSIKKANASSNEIPIFVSIDEEGGRISRIPNQVLSLPSNYTIGKLKDEKLSYEIGLSLADKVRAFGFNMDFAPVMDINSNPNNPVIGDRAFGADADLVSSLGVQTMLGIMAGGVIPVVKHFPGHGDTSVDSHLGLPNVNNDLKRLESFEFIPFVHAIAEGAPCVMAAHIRLLKIDNTYPATLSETIIEDLLRKQLKFDGVVITDDMTMGAIAKNYDIEAAVLQSVRAGNDIILIAHKYENALLAFNAIEKAVVEGKITEERINQSVYRILKVKHAFNLQDNEIPSLDIAELNNKINGTLSKIK